MATHFENHDRRPQHEADPQAPLHVDAFRARTGVHGCDFRFKRHAADRAAARTRLANLRMHRTGVDRSSSRGFRRQFLGNEVACRVGFEFGPAAGRAEKIIVGRMGGAVRRRLRVDRHAANRVLHASANRRSVLSMRVNIVFYIHAGAPSAAHSPCRISEAFALCSVILMAQKAYGRRRRPEQGRSSRTRGSLQSAGSQEQFSAVSTCQRLVIASQPTSKRLPPVSRAQRLLDLIQLLRRHRFPVSGASMASELGVSLRTIYRDVETLISQGARIDGEAGVGYVLRPGFMLPPLMFSEEEIEALVLGSRWVSERADGLLGKAARNVLAKI